MPYQRYAVILHKLELRVNALAANIEELPHLREPVARLSEMLNALRSLMVEQARLAAERQDISKQIAELSNQAQKLMTFLDTGVKQHYGNRSERLTAYGLQPFRSKPRVRKIGPDGKPFERKADEEPPETQE